MTKQQLHFIIVSILLIFLSNTSYSNDSLLMREIPIKNIDKVTHDQFFNFYISTTTGQLYKYDKNGNLLLTNSPAKPQAIHNLEANNTIRIFTFYKELQEFNYFDRFLTFENQIKIDPQLIGYAKTATTSSDNGIWIFDEADYSLKKYDPIQLKILQNTSCSFIFEQGEHNISYMKEYQNKLYLVEKDSCVYVFDNMGNFNKKINTAKIKQLSFFNNEMVVLSEKKVYFLDLYDSFKVTEILLDSDYEHYFKSDSHFYVFNSTKMKIFKNAISK